MTAVTIVAEVGALSRFASAPQLMGYSGLVAREHSSGNRMRRGGITKTGNAHLRRSWWRRRGRTNIGRTSGARSENEATLERRSERDRLEGAVSAARALSKLLGRGKVRSKSSTAVGRELLGFIWAIGVTAEREQQRRRRSCGVTQTTRQTAATMAVEGHTERRILVRLCGRPPGPTRALSPRQLPTDHDYAVPTREYQSDQSSR